MKRLTVIVTAIVLVAGSAAQSANITIFDGMSGGFYSWYNTTQEDQEVEPNTSPSQRWDLEAFLLDGSTLTLIGGFDFVNGVYENSSRPDQVRQDIWDAGDIFIDVNGDAVYGSAIDMAQYDVAARHVYDNFGYDYVLDIDWEGALTYDVLALTNPDDPLLTVYFDQNEWANPWRYVEGGSAVDGYQDLALIDYYSDAGSVVEGVALEGGSADYPHYVAKFDLGFLNLGDIDEMYVHTTLECGNDSLMGYTDNPGLLGGDTVDYTVPDGGATIALLGVALVGLAALAGRR